MNKFDPFLNKAFLSFSTWNKHIQEKQPSNLLKCPKGCRDLGPKQSAVRRDAINKIVDIFQTHGGVQIDTPVFQLTQLLVGKYGAGSKLIYDLADQGGQQLSLRYDLTVPFSRYIASNGIKKIKRYQVGKVYRRDNPVMTKGRFRQFYQCDFDMAGEYDLMLPEAQVLKIVNDVLQKFKLGQFQIRINSRAILEQMISNADIAKELFKTTCSSLDKLDKQPWQQIRKQLIQQKNISVQSVQKVGLLVKYKGTLFQIANTLLDKNLMPGAEKLLKQLLLLDKYLVAYNIQKNVVFDLSLARGLDYYTGLIFQANFKGKYQQLGSVSAGGRYDNLIGDLSGVNIPAIGGSIGIQRIFAALQRQTTTNKCNKSMVLVASIGKGMASARMSILNILWQNGIRAQHLFNQSPKPQKQLSYAFQQLIPMIIWTGQDQVKSGVYNLKILYKGTQIKGKLQQLLPRIKLEQKQFIKRAAQGAIIFQKGQKKK